jgi:L,D-peptidoglycan transpeptidase YkuD (ErfK/YbiS/YcfS/YnhG family)
MRRLPLLLATLSVLTLVAPTPAASAAAPVYCRLNPTFAVAQVIWVDGSGSRQTTRLCARVSPGRYVVQGGPYAGHLGRNGVAAAGAKREGDGKTPSGSYPMRTGFGVYRNPGFASTWLVTTSRDVWVDDPRSSLYNLRSRTPVNGRWRSAEALHQSPAYNYSQVIGYNEGRVRGRGSAIFLHVDQARGTAGCVSLPTSSLLKVLRWQKRGAYMWIMQ